MERQFKNQSELFNWIWENRDHISEITADLLPYQKGHDHWHFQFLHVLPKGSYPSEKLNPDNVILGTPYEHTNQETYAVFNILRQRRTREYHDKNRIRKIV
jgi:hypothetical protein